ncbi:hypothetical protein V1227_11480 [Lentzea sp. DG1S-22]|uniref:hypothetical protein n=1 Tax=Lentzea sp. DG1S-22 TaxID=3108822 RepID=UPI002E75CB17|nr:hypothetical protein [Lentzea sp. DG1S-22]WVH83340.1 hypothetical protein V1227_11480 [Lentzea sp. DG1S-22]
MTGWRELIESGNADVLSGGAPAFVRPWTDSFDPVMDEPVHDQPQDSPKFQISPAVI